jgi:hypothetical protein
MVVELQRKMAARIRRKRHRFAAHDFGQNRGHVLGVTGGGPSGRIYDLEEAIRAAHRWDERSRCAW